jgi:WD40 repeat protein
MSRVFIFFCVFLFVSSRALTDSSVAPTQLHGQHPFLKVSGGITVRPGIISWSPDGRRIAFISTSLRIFDTESRAIRKVDVKEPSFVRWTSDGSLLVIYNEKGRKSLCSVDPVSLVVKKFHLDVEPDAVFPLRGPDGKDGRELVIVSSQFDFISIGTRVAYRILTYNPDEGRLKDLYSFGRILPFQPSDSLYLKGWMHAGLNPLDGSLLIMEHHNPPMVMLYSDVAVVDAVLGGKEDFSDQEQGVKRAYISASWSPDGGRIALTDSDGDLEIRDFGADAVYPTEDVEGVYPSWNPGGSQIFLGGFVIDSDGKNRVKLLSGAGGSLAAWSPDGTMVAVASGKELYLFENFMPHFITPDKPFDEDRSRRILLLKKLLREGLLTKDEYRLRYQRLFSNRDEKK